MQRFIVKDDWRNGVTVFEEVKLSPRQRHEILFPPKPSVRLEKLQKEMVDLDAYCLNEIRNSVSIKKLIINGSDVPFKDFKWETTADSRVRPEHINMRFPSPETINCRCSARTLYDNGEVIDTTARETPLKIKGPE